MSNNIYHNFIIKASLQDVFDAVTLPQHLDNWWTLKSSGQPQLNAEYNLNFTDTYDWYCKVSKVTPHKSFHLKMLKADEDWNPTTFGFELEANKNGTMVRFSHVDWPKNNDHFKHSSFCWALLLNGLKSYLENGIVIPFEERN